MSLQGDVSEGICICITLPSMTIRYVRLVTLYSARKCNSIKKSQLDRIENGHRREGGVCAQSLRMIIIKKFSFLSTLPVEYLTDGWKEAKPLGDSVQIYLATVQARTLYTVFVRLRDRIMKYRCQPGEWKRKETERKEKRRRRRRKKKEEIFHLHADCSPTSSLPDCSISNPPTFHLLLTFEIRGFIVSNSFFFLFWPDKIGQIYSSSNIKQICVYIYFDNDGLLFVPRATYRKERYSKNISLPWNIAR